MPRILIASAVALLAITALAARGACGEEWGTLRGRFLFAGGTPAVTELRIKESDVYCAGKRLTDEQLVVHRESGGVSNVVVSMYLKPGLQVPVPHPSHNAKLKSPVVLNIASCRFTPHVVFVRSGQPFVVRNNDPVEHNFAIAFDGVGRLQGTISAGSELTKEFSGRERRPTPVSSNTRPWMTGYVFVLDHPYGAVSTEDGQFVIEDLPAGKWIFHFWHERTGNLSGIAVGGEKSVVSRGLVELTIQPGDNDLGDIHVKPAAR